jgi:hypothetical protein
MKKILGVIFHPTKNNKIKKSLLLLTVAFFVGGFFVVKNNASASDQPDVLINEFFINPSGDGDEWYELLNTTSNDINLEGWSLSRNSGPISLSGIIPANGILVVSANNVEGNDTMDIVLLKEGETIIFGFSYGDDESGLISSDVPEENEYVYFSYNDWTYYTSDNHTKGWFNDAVDWSCKQPKGEESPLDSPPKLSSIAACLAEDNILTNLPGSGNVPNPSEATNFYFAKVIDIEEEPEIPSNVIGKISFAGPVNLTDQVTVEYLMGLYEKLDIDAENGNYAKVGLNTLFEGTETQFKEMPATITMGQLTGLTDGPNLIVKNDNGDVISSDSEDYPNITVIGFDNSDGIFTFDTDHFTTFETAVDGEITVCSSGCDHTTIQAAIDAADSGDIIKVKEGTYVEDLAIEKSLTLQGEGFTKTEIQPTSSANTAITIKANNVVIEGFTITHPTALTYGIKVDNPVVAATKGVMLAPETSGLTLKDLNITNIGDASASANGYGLYISNSLSSLDIIDSNFISGYRGTGSRGIGVFAPNNLTLSDYNITGSTFEYLFVGVYLRSSIDGLDITASTFGPTEIEDCTAVGAGVYIGDGSDDNFDIENINITNNIFTSYGRGVYVWNYAENSKISNFDITYNTFTNSIWSSAVRFIAGLGDDEDISFSGIDVSHNILTQDSDVGASIGLIDFRSYSTNADFDIEVVDNDITLSGGRYKDAIHGIMFFPWESPFNNTLVKDNTLDGGSTAGEGTPLSTGIAVSHKATTYWPTKTLEIDVKGNTITGFDNGLCVYDLVDSEYGNLPTGSKIDITNNSILGNSAYGVRNDNGEKVDARLNWWGHSDGPVVAVQERDVLDAAIQEVVEEETREKVSENVLFDPWWVNEEMTRDSDYTVPGGPLNFSPPAGGGEPEGEVLGEEDETEGEVLGETDSRDYEEQEEEKEEELEGLQGDKNRVERMKGIVNVLLDLLEDGEEKDMLLDLLATLEELEEALEEEIEETEEELEEIARKRSLTQQKERADGMKEIINDLFEEAGDDEEMIASLEEALRRVEEIEGEIEEQLNA